MKKIILLLLLGTFLSLNVYSKETKKETNIITIETSNDIEVPLEIEDWMIYNDFWFTIDTIYVEEPIKLEKWMISPIFKNFNKKFNKYFYKRDRLSKKNYIFTQLNYKR